MIRAVLAASIVSLLPSGRAAETWVGSGTGPWSTNANWLDGSAPPAGGGATQAIQFTDLQAATVSATLDLGLFSLNTLSFDARLPATATITATGGAKLRFTGAGAGLLFNGESNATVSAPIVLATTSTPLQITGNGVGTLTLSGTISEETTLRSVTIQTSAPRADLGVVALTTANSYTGGTDLVSGGLKIGNATALGTGALSVHGGWLTFGAATVGTNAQLYTDLVVANTASTTWSGVISSQTAGTGLTMRGGGTLTLSSPSSYTGATVLDYSLTPSLSFTTTGPRLTLSGASALLSSSAYTVRASGRLTLEANAGGSTDRLSQSAPVNLQGAQLRFADTGTNGNTKSEAIGIVKVAGQSTIALQSSVSSLTLDVFDVQRVDRGTLLATGIGTGSGLTRLLSETAPTMVGTSTTGGTNLKIVPFAVGDSGADLAGSSFVTYTGSTGFRILSIATEYALSLTSGADQNVRLTASVAAATATMNSLWLAGGSINVTGTAPSLTITSGALASVGTNSIAPLVKFLTAEGIITVVSGTLTTSGAISGTNGLTKSGAGILSLAATNTFSGPLTIAAGTISFSALNQLGTDTGAIVLHGNGTGLTYTGASALLLTRALAINSGVALVKTTGNGDLTLKNGTTGPGGLQVVGNATGRIILNSAVQHTGPTIFSGGRISFGADSNLGQGGDLAVTAASTLELSGAWTSARRIELNSTLVLKPGGFDVTLSGPLTGSGAITKTTAGNVSLTGASTLTSTINFDTGRLILAGAGAIRSGTINLTTGAILEFDNTAQALSNRLSGNGNLNITDGALQLDGNAAANVTETLGMITHLASDSVGGLSLTLTAPGTAGTILKAASLGTTIATVFYPQTATPMLVAGANLGGAPTGAFTRLVLATAPGGFRGDVVVVDNGTTSFATYDPTIDAAGPIGLRALQGGEYASATSIRNPVNGGGTPTSAHLFLSGNGSATGTVNTAQTLTMAAGSQLTLAAGQTLVLTQGGVLSQGAPALISGGTVDLGATPIGFYLAGDLQFASGVSTAAGLITKAGPGSLLLQPGAQVGGNLYVTEGKAIVSSSNALANSTATIASAATLEITAPTAVRYVEGGGQFVVDSGGELGLGATTAADLTFAVAISGQGGVRVGASDPNARRVFPSANTFSGGLTLDAGILVSGASAAFGTGTLTFNNGSIEGASGSFTLNNPMLLNGTLTFYQNVSQNQNIAGPGNLGITGDVLFGVSQVIDITGAVSASYAFNTNSLGSAATYIVAGALGSVRPAGGIRLGPYTTLQLPEATAFTGPAGGRIGDTTPLELTSGTLQFGNGLATNVSETIGPLRLAGFSALNLGAVNTQGTGSTTLTAATLERVNRGTMEILPSRTLGSAGTSSGFVYFTTAPATSDGGVVPYAIAKLDGGTDKYGVVVYEPANGLRLLAAGEYTTTIAGATAASHLMVPSGGLVNSGSLTVRTLDLGITSGQLTGGGSLTVAGGLVLYPDGLNRQVDNTINFGAQEGFIAVPLLTDSALDFQRPVTGSGGLTIYGRGLVALSGGNQVSGGLVINGSARLQLTSVAQLGPDVGPVQINGGELGAGVELAAVSVDVTRAVQVNSGYFYAGAPASGTTLTLSGGISGSGGLYVPDRLSTGNLFQGYTRLVANTYTGATIIGGHVEISSDAGFGTGGGVQMASGTVRLLGNWTTVRRFESLNNSGTSLTVDTNGFTADFQGSLAGTNYDPFLIKKGAGTLQLSLPEDAVTTKYQVIQGDLVLQGTARVDSSSIEVDTGGRFIVDNRTQVAPRGTLNFTPNGGEYLILGNAGQASMLTGSLNIGGGDAGIVTLASAGSAPVVMDLTSMQINSGSHLLVRGDQLGGATGAFTRLRAGSAPILQNGVLPYVLVDSSSAGSGSSFATYDTSTDANGVVGLRPLRASEMAATPELRNPANGGATALTANFLAAGDVTAGGAANTVYTLTMAPGSRITLGAGQSLTIGSGALLIQSGAIAELSGGTVHSTNDMRLLGGGDLRLGARLVSGDTWAHYGPGNLLVTQVQPPSIFSISDGALQAGAGDPLAQSTIYLHSPGRFDVGGTVTRVASLNSTGAVNLAGGNLGITGGAAGTASAFTGSVTGTGIFGTAGPVALTLSAANSFAGTLSVNDGSISVKGTFPNLAGVSITDGTLSLDNELAGSAAPRLASAPVAMSSGRLQFNSYPNATTTATFGALTGEGFNFLLIYNGSNPVAGTEARLT
ncbi:MAG TPA: autotransporter-associated beta strand repeat-containing protein, partial [Chthoniobacteraceae bacterium]|nr:autotransporter-associated beta strand repeat-containing protein [Chthoniobacteraceae bacterium]